MSSSARDSSSPSSWTLSVRMLVPVSRRAFFCSLSWSTVCWLGFMANAVVASDVSEFSLSNGVEKCSLRGVGPLLGPWWGAAWTVVARLWALLGCWEAALSDCSMDRDCSWDSSWLFAFCVACSTCLRKRSVSGGDPLMAAPLQGFFKAPVRMIRCCPSRCKLRPHWVQETFSPFCQSA